MYKVYIIYSNSLQKYYVGHSKDVEIRLSQHNSGKGNFTSKGIPWILINEITGLSKGEAVRLETKIKKRGIERFLDDRK